MKINKDILKDDLKYAVPVIGGIVFMCVILNIIFGTVCPLRIIAGIPCPGCGVTRAFGKVLHLDLVGATRMHAFWIPILILAVWFGIVRYFVTDKEKQSRQKKILHIVTVVVAVLAIVYYIYRMIAVFPGPAPMEDDHMWFRFIHR